MDNLIIQCCCSGKCKEDEPLVVIDFEDGDCEINGIYLDKKAVKKLIEYLSKLK